MSDVVFQLIPDTYRETVRTALRTAFGGASIAALQPVGGGASGALIYRVDVAERPYLVRVETRRGPLRNPHQYVCMQTAANAGIAPPLRYADAETGVAIMDFIQQRPLQLMERRADHQGQLMVEAEISRSPWRRAAV